MTTAPLIPREVLFDDPAACSPQLAPDGRRLAWLAAAEDGVANLRCEPLPPPGQPVGLDAHAAPLTGYRDRGVTWFRWSRDGSRLLYGRDQKGDECWQLRAIDPATGANRGLTPAGGVHAAVVATGARRPHEVLVTMNPDEGPRFDLYRIDVRSGATTRVLENRDGLVDWLADADLEPRAALSLEPDGGARLLARRPGDGGWQEVLAWGREDILASGPVGVDADGRALYVIDSRGPGTARLVRLDLRRGGGTTVMRDPDLDPVRVLRDQRDGHILAAATEGDRTRWHVLDPAYADDFAFLGDAVDGDIFPFSRDRDDRRWIVAVTADTHPLDFHLFEREPRALHLLARHQPQLSAYRLAPMRPIGLRARDNLALHGYLARPVDAPPGPLPLVLKLHGGPWDRDRWEFDPEVQWLANRGYACLQVNYRGSTGYGKALVNAGDREWGGRMQDDVDDALDWAVATGIADPGRLCVFGRSYGGYAALMAAIRRGTGLRCAVDLMGPTDLGAFIDGLPPHLDRYRAIFLDRVGDPGRDADFLWERSPLAHAERLRTPLFIAHADNDPRVDRAHADRLVAVLDARGAEYRYHRLGEEGHGAGSPAAREALYAALEGFLAHHLGGRCQEPSA